MSPFEPQTHGPAHQVLRERCSRMGIPTWGCDSAGAICEEPLEPGLAGLWLRSSEVSALVESVARAYARSPGARIAQPCSGLRLLLLPESAHGRGRHFTVAAALGPELLDDALFALVCRTAHLEPHAARQTLARLAVFEGNSAEPAFALLSAMAGDLAEARELDGTIDGFTSELTQSYETLNVLYEVGASMQGIDEPERFLSRMCKLVHETLPYGWLAAAFSPDTALAGPLAGVLHTRGLPSAAVHELRAIADSARAGLSHTKRSLILRETFSPASRPTGQGLAQAILRGSEVAGVLIAGERRGDDPQVTSYDTKFLEAAAGFAGGFLDNAALYADVQSMFLGSVQALTAAIDAKDRYTRGHSQRVAELARMLALEAGLDQATAKRVHLCGILHDVGKIGVPEAVLCKNGRLTDEEFGHIKRHPQIGHTILAGIPQLRDVLPGVLHHHERWDGRGYPHGLVAGAAPVQARLIGLADAFDAMSSTRSYRAAMPRETVLAEVQRCAGSQFDPDLAPLIARIDLSIYDAMVARHAAGEDDAGVWRAAA